jgi:penicillin-insensitive murein endopeptidase
VAQVVEVGAPALVAADAGTTAAREVTLPELLSTLPSASSSTSIGSPTNGRLEGGVPLPLLGPGFRYNDRRSRDARYGTVETVRAIARAASFVRDDLPGSELLVNDIGLVQGGRISHHGSHRAGRDADILFFLLGDDGKPIESVGAPLDPEGIGFDYKDLSLPEDDLRVHFDAARTWRFVQALLADRESPVQRIFVVEHLRARLLAEAERSGAPAALVTRFADVSCQPGYPHDDHLHVRWYCSVEDLRAGCEDLPPLYPWRAAALEAEGQKPVMTSKTRSEEPAPVVTQEEAARTVAKASPHADVVAFLKRRKAWEKQPHPGRPYCK